MLVFIFIFLIAFLIISIRRLDWGLMLVLVGLPLYLVRFNILGVPMTLLEGMIVLIFVVWFFQNYKQIFRNIKSKILSAGRYGNNEKLVNNYRYPFGVELILVLIVSFVAMGVSSFSDSAMGIWKAYFFEPIIIYLLIFNIFFVPPRRTDEQQNGEGWSLDKVILKIILPLSISAFIVSAFAIYQKITGAFIPNEFWAAAETRRVTSFFGYPNAIGLFLGPIFMMMFGYLCFMHDKYKKQSCRVQCEQWSPFSLHWFKIMPREEKFIFSFMKITMLLSILAIYFARSEGALIAVVLAVIMLIFFSQPFKSLGSSRAVIIISAIFLLIFIFSFAPLREFAINKINLNDFSGQIRKAQWQDTGIMLRDGAWLMGAGLAGYQEKIEPYHADGIYIRNNDPDFDHLIKVSPEYQKEHWQPLEIFLYPHNIFLNFWVELGLAGMLLFIWIIFRVFYLSIKILLSPLLSKGVVGGGFTEENRYLLLGAMSAMFVLVIHGIVDVPYFKNDLAIIFWVIVALIGIVQLNLKMKN